MLNTDFSSAVLSTQKHSTGQIGLPVTKTCKICEQSLPLSQFRMRKEGYRRTECIPCNNALAAERRKTHPQLKMLSDAKIRAKKRGLEFDLTEEYLISIDRDTCPYLFIPISWGAGKGLRQADSKSLDRIDSAKGYTRDNVIICSWKANRLLSDASLSDISLLAHNFRRILNSTKPTNQWPSFS